MAVPIGAAAGATAGVAARIAARVAARAAARAAAGAAARAAAGVLKKGGWFERVPRDILFSPGGMVLTLLALIIEGMDWLPIPPVLDQILEIPLEINFYILFIQIVKPSIKSLIIPFGLERIAGLSDILPTLLLKMFL
ncbi:MAG: hypothetical protein QME57_02665 [Patescibacteria group bacterium]|nr:hypothetical protein [Patescibacteria group bacterium]